MSKHKYLILGIILPLFISIFMFSTHKQEKIIISTIVKETKKIHIATELLCLADNIYFESRNESIKGQVAVALVTINRVKSTKYPNTICEVVWEYKQFSWTIDKLINRPIKKQSKEAYRLAELIAVTFIANTYSTKYIHDFTKGSNHYHANYIRPYWAKNLKYVMAIDKHMFYKGK